MKERKEICYKTRVAFVVQNFIIRNNLLKRHGLGFSAKKWERETESHTDGETLDAWEFSSNLRN